MTSVERILEYCSLESEAPGETDTKPSDNWPSKGKIEFENVSFRYHKSLPRVLHSISCSINSNEKVISFTSYYVLSVCLIVCLASSHSLTHSLTHALSHARSHARTHARTHSRTHALTHSCTHSVTHSRTQSRTYAFSHSLTHSVTHSRIQSRIQFVVSEYKNSTSRSFR